MNDFCILGCDKAMIPLPADNMQCIQLSETAEDKASSGGLADYSRPPTEFSSKAEIEVADSSLTKACIL